MNRFTFANVGGVDVNSKVWPGSVVERNTFKKGEVISTAAFRI